VREQRLEKSQSSALMASSSIQYKANYAWQKYYYGVGSSPGFQSKMMIAFSW
jgi:hypothetical protein